MHTKQTFLLLRLKELQNQGDLCLTFSRSLLAPELYRLEKSDIPGQVATKLLKSIKIKPFDVIR